MVRHHRFQNPGAWYRRQYRPADRCRSRIANLDASLFKTFNFNERFKMQFRSEWLNLSNTPRFAVSSIGNTQGNSNYGRLSATLPGTARNVQFALALHVLKFRNDGPAPVDDQRHVLGEGAVPADTETDGLGTQVPATCEAVAAAAAHDVTFPGNEVARSEVFDVRPDLDDLADELMTDESKAAGWSGPPMDPTIRCGGPCHRCRSCGPGSGRR